MIVGGPIQHSARPAPSRSPGGDRSICCDGVDELKPTASADQKRRERLNQRLRQAFLEGAEEDSRRRLELGLTAEELERILWHFPGDVVERRIAHRASPATAGGANCHRKGTTALCSGGGPEYASCQLAGGSDTRSIPGRRDRAELIGTSVVSSAA